MVICFPLGACKRSAFAFESLIIMCLLVSLSSSHLEFIELLGCSYSRLSSNLGSFRYFFKYSLFPFLSVLSSTPTMHILVHLMVSHMSLGLFSRFFNPFSFCSSVSVISTVLSSSLLILSSACSNLSLNLSVNFLIIALFQRSICLQVFF